MISSQKIRPLLFAFLFMCAAGAALGWVWYTTDVYGDRLGERFQTIANEKAFKQQYDTLLTMVVETEAERTALTQYVLQDNDDTIGLLSQFDEIAATQDIELSTRQLEIAEQPGSFNNLDASFNITGREESVIKMVRMFETLPYHGYVASLSLKRMRDEGGNIIEVEAGIAILLSIQKHDQ